MHFDSSPEEGKSSLGEGSFVGSRTLPCGDYLGVCQGRNAAAVH